MAKVLTAYGSKPVTVEMVRDDMDDWAPADPDGTIDLVYYATWLVRKMSRAE